jgi:tetratricopeptide (TPR) repeat protein
MLSLQACGWNPFGAKESYVRRGIEFADKGKYDDAAIQFRKAIQKDNRYGEAYLRFGQALKRQNNISDALYCFSRAAELMPLSAEAKIELGRTAATALLGDPRRPKSLYQIVTNTSTGLLAADPNSAEGLRLKGYLAVVDAHPPEAIDAFRKSLQSRPDQPDVLVTLAQTLILDNQGPEAETLMRNGLDRFPKYSPLYDALYGYYTSQKRTDDAERVLRQKISKSPDNSLYVVELAEHFWRQNRPDESARVLRDLIADGKKHPTAELEAGDFYARVGKFDDALAHYQNGMTVGPGYKKEYLQRIVKVRLAQGRTAEATTMISDLLRQYPDDKFALSARADLQMAGGKPDEVNQAITQLAALVKKYPDDIALKYDLARAYRQTSRDDEAAAEFRDVLQRDPANRDALRELADLSIRNQKPGEALQYAERLLELEPNNLGAQLVRTSAWALRGRYGEVRSELRRITTETPGLEEAWLQMATLDMDQRNYIEAEQILKRLYKPGEPDVRPVKALASLYMSSGHPDKAVSLLQDEAAHSPNPETRALLATSAIRSGQMNLALVTAQKLSADFPNNKDYLILLSEIQQQGGQMDAAIAGYQRAQTMGPDDPLPSALLSDALAQTNRFNEAVAASRQSLKIRPDDPRLMNNLAWNLALAGTSFDEALGLVDKALQQQPGNALFMDTRGMILLKSGKFDVARNTFQDAVRSDEMNVTFRLHLAEALMAQGQKDQARTELQNALRRHPEAPETRRIQELLKQVS